MGMPLRLWWMQAQIECILQTPLRSHCCCFTGHHISCNIVCPQNSCIVLAAQIVRLCTRCTAAVQLLS
jgi:hypothetical protein